ncbi:MAG: thiol reductant ABC exporter subunit CydC [Desulfobacteraceae bacterium]|nr:MAG: thiol reductant ABC exporter subunit CydC [Desulfobacteraceae bacterium]
MGKLWLDLAPFWRLISPYRWRMLSGTVSGLLAVSSAVGLLALAGWFLSATALAGVTAAGAMMFNFFFPSIGVRLFAFSRTGSRYLERVLTHDATLRILSGLRVWLYRHLEPLVPASLARYRSGDVLSRLVEDIDTLDNLYLRVLSPTAVALFIALLLFCFLASFDVLTAAVGCFFLLTAGFVVPAVAGSRGQKIGKRLQQSSAVLRIRLVERIQCMSELLVFDARESHTEALRKNIRDLTALQRKMNHISAVSSAAGILFSGFAWTSVLYIGVGRVSAGTLEGPTLALLSLAVLAAFEAVYSLPRAYQHLGRSREAAVRIREIIETAPDIRFPEKPLTPPLGCDIRFENIGFRYPGNPAWALRGIDFFIPAGKHIAVIGETGSGKSTLMNLLVRFRDPVNGRLRIGGQDIRELSETTLRRYVNAVPQRAHIFGSTIRKNLLLADPEAGDAQLREAIDAACLLPFVDSLPEGIDTWVGESGSLLSGGEAQRLAVARCFLRDGPIWVLDEPTEGLDQATECLLLTSIFQRTRGKTLLLITHRHSCLEQMDSILVLREGQISAMGAYAELKDRLA